MKRRKSKTIARRDVPASVGLVTEVRDELVAMIKETRAELTGTKSELTGKIEGVRSELTGKIEGVRSELTGKIEGVRSDLTAKIEELRTDLTGKIESFRTEFSMGLQQVLVAVHRTQAVVEEQRAENRIVLDGLMNVNERMDRFESDPLRGR